VSSTGAASATPAPRKFGIIKTIFLVLIAAVAVFAAVAAAQPADYRVVRQTSIAAPSAVIFAEVNDFHKWEAWSPWAKLDPNAKNTFEGPASGTGSIFKWSGNDDIGEGQMTLRDSRPDEMISIKLDFIRPFPSTCDVEFSFVPTDGKTVVTWSMTGKKDFISKAVCLFMNMDKMVGGDFERGLAALKSTAESAAKQPEPAPSENKEPAAREKKPETTEE
jgi:hypothetical protein